MADTFNEFPAFAPAFEPGPLKVGAYLVLLNLMEDASEAVLIVSRCLESAANRRQEVANLLLGSLGWRPQLVGCVALLAAEAGDRPLDALSDAACRPSWVSPQILTTLALAGPPDWPSRVERPILERGDPKGAAALRALTETDSPPLVDLAARDVDGGAQIALRWREGIAAAFDEAGLPRSW